MKIKSILERNPIIPAIKDNITLEKALNSNSEIVFIILANIVNIKEYCDKLREKNKVIYIHIDMIDGLNSTNNGIDYIMNTIKPDGILTTKSNVVAHAYKNNISVIQRFFILDTLSYEKALSNINCSIRNYAWAYAKGYKETFSKNSYSNNYRWFNKRKRRCNQCYQSWCSICFNDRN